MLPRVSVIVKVFYLRLTLLEDFAKTNPHRVFRRPKKKLISIPGRGKSLVAYGEIPKVTVEPTHYNLNYVMKRIQSN